MIDKERLAIIRDDIKWIKQGLALLDPESEDDAPLYDKYNTILKKHSEYLQEQIKILENK